MTEAHFDLRRVDVHIHFVVGHVEKEQDGRIDRRRKNVAIGFVNGVENQAIAHQPAIHENINAVAIGALNFRARGEARDRERRGFFAGLELRFHDGGAEGARRGRNFCQFVKRLAAKDLIDAVGEFLNRRAVQNFLRRRFQEELFVGIRKRIVGHKRSDVAELGCVGFQELAPRGHAIEKIGHADGCSRGQAGGLHADKFSAGKFDARAFGFFFRAGLEEKSRNGRDRRQGFAAKPERGDGEQIVHGAELARGVALESQERIVVAHAVALVYHADHALAAGFNFDAHAFRAGIERVFEQLLDDGGGPLDNLARGDFVGDSFGKDADAAHACCSLGGRSFSSGVADDVIWASAPEARCEYLLGIGSRVNWPAPEEYGQSCGFWTSFTRTGFIRMYSTLVRQSFTSRMVQS